MKTLLKFFVVACFFLNSINAHSTDKITPSFDAQLLEELKHAKTIIPMVGIKPSMPSSAVLQTFFDKFSRHEMALKNVVYRNDHSTIRITWADESNDYIIKQTYRTSSDPILENSKYADRKQAQDIKIMYRPTKGAGYEYLQVIPLVDSNMQTTISVDARPPEERCNFCHILARNEIEPNGTFFQRYQEDGQGFNVKGKASNIFDISLFEPKHESEAKSLNLPKMSEPFYYRMASISEVSKSEENARAVRTLIEIPYLVQIYALDNQKSICIGIDAGEGVIFGFGRADYICADNKAKMLHILFTNKMLYGTKEPKVTSLPYIKYK